MKSQKTFQILLMFAMAAVATGCMYGPYDGQRVSSTGSQITFSGLYPSDSANISLQAYNNVTNSWVTLETIPTSGSRIIPFTNAGDFYGWSRRRSLPSAYWKLATNGTGHFARVRAKAGSFNLYSLRGDWSTCYGENNDDYSQFVEECASHRNPEAYIYTSNYQHGPAGCTTAPSTTKSRYEVTEINSSCQRQAVSDLMESYIDRGVIDGHYNITHHDNNDFTYGHREYLRGMERYLMVYGNKWLPNGRIPFWRPATTIPTAFRQVAPSPQACNRSTDPGCTDGWDDTPITNPSPGISLPSYLQTPNICSYNFNDMTSNLRSWHNPVHGAVGGVMGNFDSPAAVVFWNWHAYVDMILADWEACP